MKVTAITTVFDKERETKSTWRYTERVVPGAAPLIGTIYVPKTTLKTIGNPKSVSVTVEKSP